MPTQEYIASGGTGNNSFSVPTTAYVRAVFVNGAAAPFTHRPAGVVSLVNTPNPRDVISIDYDFSATVDKRPGQTIFGPDTVPNRAAGNPTVVGGGNITGLSSGWEVRNGDLCFRVTGTASAATGNNIDVTFPTFGPVVGDTACAEFYISNQTQVASVTVLIGTSGFAQFMSGGRALNDFSSSQALSNAGLISMYLNKADFVKTGYTGEHTDQAWSAGRFRVVIQNGQTGTAWIRCVRLSASKPKGRLVIFADDGYENFFRLGAPILQRFGFPTTAAIIGPLVDVVGATNYVTQDELHRFVEAGNTCVPHGQFAMYGSSLTTDEQRLEDVRTNRDYLVSRGLSPGNASKCYVWPNGVYNSGDGNVAFLELMRREGFVLGRSASSTGVLFDCDLASPGVHSNFTLPIIGHTYQGVAATAGDATETTNVNTIITRIQAAGANGSDACLMLHRVVPRGGTTGGAGTIEIETDRLLAIANAINTEVVAGRLEVVTFDKLIPS